ncbi:MAG: cytochrome c biogenesis protein CcsA [Planctomycetes bacterium]|nr:cytochrome c biogenesis protein CcsA [Planctomycetota bacterium]
MNKTRLQQYLPALIAVGVTAIYFGINMRPRSDASGEFQYAKFGRLAVIDGGRLKPMQTVAQTKLMIVTHRSALSEKEGTFPAAKWLLDCMTTPLPGDPIFSAMFPDGAEAAVAFKQEVFRIENDQVLRLLKLTPRSGYRYSIVDIAPRYPELEQAVKEVLGDETRGIPAKDPKNYKLYDAKVAELWQHLNLYMKAAHHGTLLVIPNPDGSDQWTTFRDAHAKFGDAFDQDQLPDAPDAKAYGFYRTLLVAYQSKDKAGFNRALDSYLATSQGGGLINPTKIGVEIFFNNFAPFYLCLVVYGFVAVIAGFSWLAPAWTRQIQQGCYAAMALAFVVHISGLVLRMYLQDRLFVFVTNLYSSAVFIGLGCVFFCLIAEVFYKNGIAIVVGTTTGFCTLIIAHMLSLSGDTMEMMQAVLDTNFWLATHVTIITLGYTSAFVAGFMGIAYIFLGLFTNMLRKEGSAELTRMTYGVLCAGMFLSFVGTVLGGLWADYSWGRFWGWDPKENGALLIVIWIALILHARWGGMVKQRGIAVLSVLGIVVTSWSWFGTNFLGVGLHSYGFRQGAMMTLILIDLGFIAIAGLGLIPLEHWTSFRPHEPTPFKPTGGARPKPAGV